MRFFLDTEFSERGSTYPIQLISIGIVCEDGRVLYAENKQCDLASCNDWVKKNVVPNLHGPRYTVAEIGQAIKTFVGDDKPEFWGYYSDYDWVVFCQIFGSMVDLPKGWPMYCRDIKQLCDSKGNPQLPKQSTIEHNALDDALWNKEAWEFLNATNPLP